MALVGHISKNTVYTPILNIGKGFCFELARRGQNIVLVSRTVSKLQEVAAEIEEKYKVKTKIVDIDFTKDQNIQERIEAETKVI